MTSALRLGLQRLEGVPLAEDVDVKQVVLPGPPGNSKDPEINLHSLLSSSGQIGVSLRVDGNCFVAGLQLAGAEHLRRGHLGLSAASSRALLHALWMLPHGIPIPWDSVSELDRDTLSQEGDGWITHDGRTALRTYQPAGRVASIVVANSSLSRAVSRAATHAPTSQRIALWRRESSRPPRHHSEQIRRAQALGIGVYTVFDGECTELLEPAPALLGIPAVFRWWIAELAYRNWLMHTAPTARVELSA